MKGNSRFKEAHWPIKFFFNDIRRKKKRLVHGWVGLIPLPVPCTVSIHFPPFLKSLKSALRGFLTLSNQVKITSPSSGEEMKAGELGGGLRNSPRATFLHVWSDLLI